MPVPRITVTSVKKAIKKASPKKAKQAKKASPKKVAPKKAAKKASPKKSAAKKSAKTAAGSKQMMYAPASGSALESKVKIKAACSLLEECFAPKATNIAGKAKIAHAILQTVLASL